MTGVVDERGVEYTPPNRGKTLAESAWDKLDGVFDEFMGLQARFVTDGKNDSPLLLQMENLKGWCQGLAWTIHMWTPHYYKTPDDVTREAVKRREIRLGQRDFEPTPGYQYNPMPPSHRDFARINKKAYMPGEAAKDEAREAEQRATQNKAKAVSPADIKLIKDAYAMFNDADEVARILSIDVNVVKSHI